MSFLTPPTISHSTHIKHLTQTLTLARLSPPKPTNFRVGCVIVSFPLDHSPTSPSTPQVLSTGYTLELEGNTHAEQCALTKLLSSSDPDTNTLSTLFPASKNQYIILYTSLEPCSLRLSGATPCVQRILSTIPQTQPQPSSDQDTARDRGGINKIIFGAKEPGTFVQDSQSCRILSDAGVAWEYIPDLEGEILEVAMEGHFKKDDSTKEVGQQQQETTTTNTSKEKKETRIDDITDEERRRQEALPRNPKKRMMELDRGGL